MPYFRYIASKNSLAAALHSSSIHNVLHLILVLILSPKSESFFKKKNFLLLFAALRSQLLLQVDDINYQFEIC